MELEGKIWKSKKFWLVEVPLLDIMTQGKTRKEALKMIKEAIFDLADFYFPKSLIRNLDIGIIDYQNKTIGITTNNTKLISAFSLIRQRENSGSTVRQVAERLGSKSPNSYAQYEKGKTNITLDKYELLLKAVNPEQHIQLRLVQI